MDKRARWIGGGAVAAVAAAGVAAWWFNRSEQPRHTLIQRDGAVEVRDYPAALVAQTVQSGLRQTALSKGFERLADYIFARSRMGERIAMTAPVLSDGAGEAGWRTRFFIPRGESA
ncbi:heme-binding protein [Sphingomonas baiyangensis]|uniref:Heme-binding protein n=1 Tax=Sphingomonas baiyangensis TaxID=2572576 RepID=A0A4U1L4W2_9SPHN|nr:heme-binding protein [Sphingomonas baiyangensis]